MSKNLRALTDDELKWVNDNYTFEILDYNEGYRVIFDYVKNKLDDKSQKELKELIDNFVKTNSKYIVVTTKTYNSRKVLHNINESFLISTSMRKISFSKEAINYWINDFKDEYSLIEVQNAISVLTITYQPINKEEIRNQLKRKTSKIAIV